MATGFIFSNARIRLTTTTCYWPGSSYGNANAASSVNGLNTCMYYDLSPFSQSVRLTLDSETRDNTVMGSSFRKQLTALRSATAEVRVLQSYANVQEPIETCGGTVGRNIDGLMYDLYNASNPFYLVVRPDNTSRSSCNPDWILPVVLGTHTPLDGAVADLPTMTLRFTSQGAPTRETCTT